MRYQIYEAKSVKYDAQQRGGMMKILCSFSKDSTWISLK